MQSSKNLFIILISCLLLSLTNSAAATASDKLTVILDWFPNPNHAPLFVALQQGFFKAQHLNIEVISPADPNDPPKLVAANQAEIALTYQPQLLLQVTQGLPLVRIATLIASPLNCLAVSAASPIRTIADLKNKQIGYSSDIDNAILTSMLQKNGVSLKDVTLTNVHFNLTQALLNHKVDAIVGIMRNFEPLQMTQQGLHPRLFYPEQNGIPAYDELIFVTNRQLAHDPRLPRFVKALRLATQYVIQHPQESWSSFAQTHPELNNSFNRKVWFTTLPFFALDPVRFDSKRYENFAIFLKKQGLIPHIPSIKDYAITLQPP